MTGDDLKDGVCGFADHPTGHAGANAPLSPPPDIASRIRVGSVAQAKKNICSPGHISVRRRR